MHNDQKQQLHQSRPHETAGGLQPDAHAIDDLSPNDRQVNEVRGGALPPDGLRASALPPEGQTLVYVTPPEG